MVSPAFAGNARAGTGPVVAEQVVKVDEPRRRMASMAGSPSQLENATRDLFRLSGGQSIPVEARLPSPEPKPQSAPAPLRQPEPASSSETKKEASILFSLENLMKTAAPSEKPDRPDEQLWNMRAEAPLFGTAQDHALLTTPLDPPPRSAAMDSMTMSSRRPTGVRLWPLLLAVVGGCGVILAIASWIVLKPSASQQAAAQVIEAPTAEPAGSPAREPAAEPARVAALAEAEPAAAEPAPAPAAPSVEPAALKDAPDEPAANEESAAEEESSEKPSSAHSRHAAASSSRKRPAPRSTRPAPRSTKPAPPFNVAAAKNALVSAAVKAGSCPGGGKGKVQLTFAPNGRVSSAQITEGPLSGTAAGKCVLKHFRAARVPAFSGGAQTVAKSFKVK